MKVLFQLPFPGFLRMYGSTISLLSERGHRVLLAYDQPDRRRDRTAASIEAAEGIEIVSPLPAPSRRFERQIGRLRLAIDYLRYLDPRFAGSPYLRRRLEKYLDGPLVVLKHAPGRLPFTRALVRGLVAVERLVPSDDQLEAAISAHAPDVVVVTPLIGRGTRDRQQSDTVKAARRLDIPVGFAVSTWDQLTTKGIVKTPPDRTFVWNEIQRDEAREFHSLPPDRVVVTGAQLFDHWFERSRSCSREEFLERVGLDPARRYVLYVGSSRTIARAKHEIPFARRWITALRESGDPVLEEIGVLVRPHPYNVRRWAEVDLTDLGGAVAPRVAPELPMSDEDEALYYDSIHFSSAVVGINTTAMVEAFIQLRPVLTIRTREFRQTQEGTVHFRHLASAGGSALQVAETIEEHLGQLRDAVDHPERRREAIDDFLLTFVRPHGLDRAATPILASAIEDLAALRSASDPSPGDRITVSVQPASK
jgi:hypothetical protein